MSASEWPHDPGGQLGGIGYFHPIHRPGSAYWRPIDRKARLWNRMSIAAEDASALVGIGNNLSDPSQIAATMKALIVSVNALHALMAQFHRWFESAGRLGKPTQIAERERGLFAAHQVDAPFPGAIKRVRDKIAAHVDVDADEVDILELYAELERLKTGLAPVLKSTFEYVNFIMSLGIGEWSREEGGSIHICQKGLPPLTIAEERALK